LSEQFVTVRLRSDLAWRIAQLLPGEGYYGDSLVETLTDFVEEAVRSEIAYWEQNREDDEPSGIPRLRDRRPSA
jgi:hypothetical protein